MTREAYEAAHHLRFHCTAPPESDADPLWVMWQEADRQAREACAEICWGLENEFSDACVRAKGTERDPLTGNRLQRRFYVPVK